MRVFYRPSRSLPPALALALTASLLAHAALLALPASERAGNVAVAVVALQTQLASPPGPPGDAWTAIAAEPLVPLALQPVTLAPVNATAIGRPGDVRVAAREVFELSRLGDLLERQMNEFPQEVQARARFRRIEASYPPAARAQGIEGTVLAWVVIDPTANVEEIRIVEGDDVFRDAVVEAIRSGTYMPAADGGVGVRFPLLLEFRFALDTPRAPSMRPDAPAANAIATRTADPLAPGVR